MMKGLVKMMMLFCLAGCANNANKAGVLDKEKMQAVLWDVIQADVFTDQFIKKDSIKNAAVENAQLKNKIFALHKVSRADFYKSYDYYVVHTDLMRGVLDSITAKAERDRGQMIQQQHSPSIPTKVQPAIAK